MWLALVFPSSFVVHKYFGWELTIAYAFIVALIVALKPQLSERLSNRNVLWPALFTLVRLAAKNVHKLVKCHAATKFPPMKSSIAASTLW